MIKLAPSILSADFARLLEDVKKVEEAGCEYLHIDVMDGHFVPNITLGPAIVKSLRKDVNMVFDTHLMIEDPIRYVDEFARLGSDGITVHLESCKDVHATLRRIREHGRKVGISIKPDTELDALLPYMDEVDMILVMSVEPGFGGQGYLEKSTERIREVRRMIETSGRNIDLEVDGGIRLDNLKMVLDAGANVIVAGSAVFHGDIERNVREINKILEA